MTLSVAPHLFQLRTSVPCSLRFGIILSLITDVGMCADENPALNAYADMLSSVRSGIIISEIDAATLSPGGDGEVVTVKHEVEYAFSGAFQAIIRRAKAPNGSIQVISRLVIDGDDVQLLRGRTLEISSRPHSASELRPVPDIELPPPLRAFSYLGYERRIPSDRFSFVWAHLADRNWVQKRLGMLAQSSAVSPTGDTLIRFTVDEITNDDVPDQGPPEKAAKTVPTSEFSLCIGTSPVHGNLALVKSIEWGPIGFNLGTGAVEERFSYKPYMTTDGIRIFLPASWEVYERGNASRIVGFDLIDVRLNIEVDKDVYRIDADLADDILDAQTRRPLGK